MALSVLVRNPLEATRDSMSLYSRRVLSPLTRADQRRWGEIYLRGILLTDGRKSVRRIAAEVAAPDAVQSLQQFVNQSPWEWGAVRAKVAEYVAERLEPTAWVIRSAYVPKRGSHTVGVARRFVPSAGRVLNCLHGLGLFFTGQRREVPVNWRLVLPGAWPADPTGRRRTGIPDAEPASPEWEQILHLVDEVTAWGGPVRPVVADLRHVAGADRLVAGLSQRGIPFVIQLGGATPASWAGIAGKTGTGDPHPGSPLPLRELTRSLPTRAGISTVRWQDHDGIPQRTQVSSMAVRLADTATPTRNNTATAPVCLLLTAGTQQRSGPFWVTSLPLDELSTALSLAQLAIRRQGDIEQLAARYGMHDFEGRSFRGWHHHMTLVSAAYAFAELDDLPDDVPISAGRNQMAMAESSN